MKLTIKESSGSQFKGRRRMSEGSRYELSPQYDARKSFYGKAHVVTDDDGSQILYSYDTPVCKITNKGDVELLSMWDSSQTTLRHVKEFLQQNGFSAGSKAQIAKMYGRAVESRRRYRGKRINEETMWTKVEPSVVQAIRKILMQNSIQILDLDERESMSKWTDGTDDIKFETVFVTDIPCFDMYDPKPGNLKRILGKIEDAIDTDRYSIFATHSKQDTWEIIVSKF